MGSLQNPFLTAPVEESLAVKKGLLVNRPFLVRLSIQKRLKYRTIPVLVPGICSIFALKPKNVFADYKNQWRLGFRPKLLVYVVKEVTVRR